MPQIIKLLSMSLIITAAAALSAAPAHAQSGSEPLIPEAVNPVSPPQQSESSFPRAEKEPPMPKVLRNYVSRGAQSKYLGYYNGLHGWAIVKGGKPEFHYVTPNGKAIVMGILFDDDGNMVTGEQLRMLRLSEGASTYKLSELSEDRRKEQREASGVDTSEITQMSEPTPKTKAERFYADVERGNWLRLGNRNAPVIYAFIDPTCSHCHRFLKDIRVPYINNGLVQVRILPMGYNQDSLKQAAYLLAAPNPMDQLYSHINGDTEALFVPGEIDTQGAALNVGILNKYDISGTPVITYKDRTGRVRFIRGAPENVAIIVDEVER